MAAYSTLKVANPPAGTRSTTLIVDDPLGRRLYWQTVPDPSPSFVLLLPSDVALPATFTFYLYSLDASSLIIGGLAYWPVSLSGGEALRADIAARSIAPVGPAAFLETLWYWDQGQGRWYEWRETLSLPQGTELYMFWLWTNLSSRTLMGHVEMTAARPDRDRVVLPAVASQDMAVDPWGSRVVGFAPITLDQAGAYLGEAVLSVREA